MAVAEQHILRNPEETFPDIAPDAPLRALLARVLAEIEDMPPALRAEIEEALR